MPKVVVRAERRDSIGRGFLSYAAVHGVAATTYARLAAELGCSVGTIQHYFASRGELVSFSFSLMLADRWSRIEALVEDGEARHRPIRDMMATALAELLPLDPVRSLELGVVQQLRVAASHDDHLATVLEAADDELHRRIATAVRNGVRCGEVEAGVDADLAATRILAVTNGLALAPREVAAHEAVLDPVLGQVFTGRCGHHDTSR